MTTAQQQYDDQALPRAKRMRIHAQNHAEEVTRFRKMACTTKNSRR